MLKQFLYPCSVNQFETITAKYNECWKKNNFSKERSYFCVHCVADPGLSDPWDPDPFSVPTFI